MLVLFIDHETRERFDLQTPPAMPMPPREGDYVCFDYDIASDMRKRKVMRVTYHISNGSVGAVVELGSPQEEST